ncbi:bifunctional 4-hydroxy-2-oxoglutarate aldolase/2-dehydro-3-deoxy-phosphogluconate aldolase [Pedobacter heparinus]|uniref:bifunctional 4-hydroxy-2-oxoglutarate aldolase/2-dehydro-3-deoxy-phosphogluconate aldolase n=1 Tax=Pedobacter heparinus TaxID=984 RepID=UPI00292F6806|nr:bifunctional 4-hydroxy-2-oxoglutarate aldolase/2-dehydro-3-deoxy-phosphogluconate aldolase [Pedobacter heparinus]
MRKISFEKILPAVTIDQPDKAILVAEALIAGGLNQLEITFRTSSTIKSITAIRENYPHLLVGAGTILTIEQLYQAKDSGAAFGLSPGLNPKIIAKADKINFPFIPGVMTPSEIELALALGCKLMKLFPAGNLGGIGMINALNGPYLHTGIQFIPMGGINVNNMNDYLSIGNVLAIGGSWLASEALVNQAAYARITANTKEAMAKLAQ